MGHPQSWRGAGGSTSPPRGWRWPGLLRAPWHCPPRACAPAPQRGARRGRWGLRACPQLLSEGDPSPSPPSSPTPGRGPMGGGWRDARPGGREEQLQPPLDGENPLTQALPGLAAPRTRCAADGTARGALWVPARGDCGSLGPLSPGRDAGRFSRAGLSQPFWGGSLWAAPRWQREAQLPQF